MQTDEELALGIQQGRKDDLAALVERHYAALAGYLYRMTGGDRMMSDDMAQETFLRTLQSIRSYQYPRPFKPWLYAIATNLVRNFYNRAETRRAAILDTSEMESAAVNDDSAQPESVLLADDETRAVITALQTLPTHQREVVVLRYYQDLSLAEIGDALSIPVGTVKSRLSLGLRRLRELMEAENGHE